MCGRTAQRQCQMRGVAVQTQDPVTNLIVVGGGGRRSDGDEAALIYLNKFDSLKFNKSIAYYSLRPEISLIVHARCIKERREKSNRIRLVAEAPTQVLVLEEMAAIFGRENWEEAEKKKIGRK